MTHFKQNKTINTLIVSALRIQEVQVKLEDSINITYGVLDTIFKMLDTEKVPATQIIPCLAILLKKQESDIANIVKKNPHNFMRKTKNYLNKNPNDIEKLHPDFSEEEKKIDLLGMSVISAKILVSQHILLKIITILKVPFHLTMEVFLKYMIILERGENPVLMICLN